MNSKALENRSSYAGELMDLGREGHPLQRAMRANEGSIPAARSSRLLDLIRWRFIRSKMDFSHTKSHIVSNGF